jgi:pyruvate/2-oxoglutarate dehydrogenase complex dihydrolipoamide acyltransferase (E2) component
MIMGKNVKGHWLKRYTAYRRIVLNSWKTPSDPTIYGLLDVDVTNLLAYMKKKKEDSGEKVSLTHAVIRALALCMKKYPDCNVLIRGSKIWVRDEVDIFCNVAMPVAEDDNKFDSDLSGVLIRNADQIKMEEVAPYLREKAKAVREKKDGKMADTRKLMKSLPNWILKKVLSITYKITYKWNKKMAATPKDPFGGALVTSVGMYGVKLAYAPLVPFTAQPIVILIGAIQDRPHVHEGEIKIRKMCSITASIDHRVLDGFQSGILARAMQLLLEKPELLEKDAADIDEI